MTSSSAHSNIPVTGTSDGLELTATSPPPFSNSAALEYSKLPQWSEMHHEDTQIVRSSSRRLLCTSCGRLINKFRMPDMDNGYQARKQSRSLQYTQEEISHRVWRSERPLALGSTINVLPFMFDGHNNKHHHLEKTYKQAPRPRRKPSHRPQSSLVYSTYTKFIFTHDHHAVPLYLGTGCHRCRLGRPTPSWHHLR